MFIKQTPLILSFLTSIFFLNAARSLAATMTTGDITFNATSSGSAVAGTTESGPTPPDRVTRSNAQAMRYDGPTEQIANYPIVLDDDSMVVPSLSSVRFTTVTYTSNGTEVRSSFQTLNIPITGITFVNDDPTMMIASFMFAATNWYPFNDLLTNNGISGTINLQNGTFRSTSSYIQNSDGAVYMYQVNGTEKPDSPVVEPLPEEFGEFEIFSPLPVAVPENTSIFSFLAFGALGFSLVLKRELNNI